MTATEQFLVIPHKGKEGTGIRVATRAGVTSKERSFLTASMRSRIGAELQELQGHYDRLRIHFPRRTFRLCLTCLRFKWIVQLSGVTRGVRGKETHRKICSIATCGKCGK